MIFCVELVVSEKKANIRFLGVDKVFVAKISQVKDDEFWMIYNNQKRKFKIYPDGEDMYWVFEDILEDKKLPSRAPNSYSGALNHSDSDNFKNLWQCIYRMKQQSEVSYLYPDF